MTNFYAKSTGGFYCDDIHGDAIPADAVEISDEAHAALLLAQSSGKTIVADDKGAPIAVLIEPTDEEKRARLQALALEALSASDVKVIRASEDGVALASEWKAYRAALRPIVAGKSDATELPVAPDAAKS